MWIIFIALAYANPFAANVSIKISLMNEIEPTTASFLIYQSILTDRRKRRRKKKRKGVEERKEYRLNSQIVKAGCGGIVLIKKCERQIRGFVVVYRESIQSFCNAEIEVCLKLT